MGPAKHLEDPTTSARGQARRDLIVEAAMRVIAERGPDGLTHRRVAAVAQIPVAATTYWFASKEELVVEAFERALNDDLARLERRRERAQRWTRKTLARELAKELHRELSEDRTTLVVNYGLWMEALRRSDLCSLAAQWNDACLAFYRDLLARIAPGVTDDDAHLVSVAVDGLVVQQLALTRVVSRQRLTALLERLFTALIGL